MNVFCPHCGSEFSIAILSGDSVSKTTSNAPPLPVVARQKSTETVQKSTVSAANLPMYGSGSGSEIRQIGSGFRSGKFAYPFEFIAFWAAYPRKKNKGAAWKAWQEAAKLHAANLPEFTAKLQDALSWQVHSKDWTKDGGQFIPHPATYLRACGWEDEPDKAPPKAKEPEQKLPDWMGKLRAWESGK